ncbi:MAG: FecR domain-containing protein [Deltaproteobacteria bacterium]|nr:FecR domain-containing protein [Candidatus Zymogenaceae bacterium]
MKDIFIHAKYIFITSLIIFVTAAAFIAPGQKEEDTVACASVARIEGSADILPAGEETWIPLTRGDSIVPGDIVETGPGCSVELNMPDGSILLVGPNTSITIDEIGTVEAVGLTTNRFQLLGGKIRAIVPHMAGRRPLFIIDTENASVGVRGTDFFESFDPNTLTTYVLGLDGCVSMTPLGGAAFDVCVREETVVMPGVIPVGSRPADDETIQKILSDMPLGGDGPTGGAEGITLPEITGAVINGRIDLDYADDEITLIRDDLTLDGVIRIEGTAAGGSLPLGRVEVSTDGGLTWNAAEGTERWTYDISPVHDTLYEIAFKATDTGGNAGDPMDMGVFDLFYRDVDSETLAREVLDRFFAAVRIGDGSALDDIISDTYDGPLHSLYSKDELIDTIMKNQEAWPHLDFSYTLDRINSTPGVIIASVGWNVSLPWGAAFGTTRWWLDGRDEYRLAHAEGDWIPDMSQENGELSLELQSATPPCSNWILLMVTAPGIPSDIETITVTVETNCGPYIKELARPLYRERTGRTDGFAVEFPVGDSAGCVVAPLCPLPTTVRYIMGPTGVLDATFTDFGYDLFESITLP